MQHESVVHSARAVRSRLSTVSDVNPFINTTTTTRHSWYETAKLALGTVLLLPVRVLSLLGVAVVSWMFASASQVGLTDADLAQPLRGWRRALLFPIPLLLRFAMFMCGFYWIPVKGRCASSAEAPIVLSNHCSFWDALFHFYYLGGPIGVAKAGVTAIPIVGPIARCLQPILVHREDKAKARAAAQTIVERARSRRWPQILIFPEGTCTNAQALIAFRIGAFTPGQPVQPVRAFPPTPLSLSLSQAHPSPPSASTDGDGPVKPM